MVFGGVSFLATYGGFGGGALGNLFAQWEAAGVFTYMLPFLLIFAVVFGLLLKINIFSDKDKNPLKGINAIIALSTSLLAMQFNLVSVFFSEIFPRFGIALSVILIIIVLGGLFMPTNKESNWFMVALAVVVFVIIGIVVYNSFESLGFGIGGPGFSFFWREYGALIIFAVLVIAIVASSVSKKDPNKPRISNILSKALGED
jgi:hypothetical protein